MTALHGIDPCWRCGDIEHWAAETDDRNRPKCPYAIRATSLAEHEKRLQFHIDRYAEGKISRDQKRQYVAEEYELWRPKRATERKTA